MLKKRLKLICGFLGHGQANGCRIYPFVPFLLPISMIIVISLMLIPLSSLCSTLNISILYLSLVVISAACWGKLPGLITALFGIVTFDFFFIPPVFYFTVDDFLFFISFSIFILIAYITGTHFSRLKKQIACSQQHESILSTLYILQQKISTEDHLDKVLECFVLNTAQALNGEVIILLPNENSHLQLYTNLETPSFFNESELAIATWTFEHQQMAGKYSSVFANAQALYLPLLTEQEMLGVMGIRFRNNTCEFAQEHRHLTEGFAAIAALAIHKFKLAEQSRRTHSITVSDQLHTAILNSISHDLRTPLSLIIGAATGLMLDKDNDYSRETRDELLQTICDGAERMNRYVTNLLDMAKLESGILKLNLDRHELQDIIGVAVNQSEGILADHPLEILLSHELPLVQADAILIEQVLVNLLDNATKYSADQSKIILTCDRLDEFLIIRVTNEGSCIPDSDLDKIFDKFYRLNSPPDVKGTGLGLTICKGIVEAHGGNIRAENNHQSGVTVSFTLPLGENTN